MVFLLAADSDTHMPWHRPSNPNLRLQSDFLINSAHTTRLIPTHKNTLGEVSQILEQGPAFAQELDQPTSHPNETSERPRHPIIFDFEMGLQSCSPIAVEALASLLLRELLVEECFSFFKQRELKRLPCSVCGQHCKTYGIQLYSMAVTDIPFGCLSVTKAGHDIYGLKIDNHDANGQLVECSICKKSVSAARFAPHLEKCMGMGRSARIKRSRVTLSKGTSNVHVSPSSASDLDDVGDADGVSDEQVVSKSTIHTRAIYPIYRAT